MQGSDVVAWRKRHGYNQDQLLRELGVKSRQTLSKWENSDGPIPRLVELALLALERIPECRESRGEPISRSEQLQYSPLEPPPIEKNARPVVIKMAPEMIADLDLVRQRLQEQAVDGRPIHRAELIRRCVASVLGEAKFGNIFDDIISFT